MALNQSLTDEIKETIDLLKKKEPFDVMRRIDKEQVNRERLSRKGNELDPKRDLRSMTQKQQLRYVEEAAIPNLIADAMQISLYLCLASCLADFEQASRYPEGKIPEAILDNLDKIDPYAENMVRYVSELYEHNGRLAAWQKMELNRRDR